MASSDVYGVTIYENSSNIYPNDINMYFGGPYWTRLDTAGNRIIFNASGSVNLARQVEQFVYDSFVGIGSAQDIYLRIQLGIPHSLYDWSNLNITWQRESALASVTINGIDSAVVAPGPQGDPIPSDASQYYLYNFGVREPTTGENGEDAVISVADGFPVRSYIVWAHFGLQLGRITDVGFALTATGFMVPIPPVPVPP